MDTDTPAAGSSPATPATPTAPATPPSVPAAPTTTPAPAANTLNAREVAASLTPVERRQFATGQKTLEQIAQARPAKTTAAPAAPAAPTAEQPPAAEAPAAPAETPAEVAATPEGAGEAQDPAGELAANADPEEKTPDRFRFKSPEDQAIALIAKTKGVTLAEAADIYRGRPAAPANAAPNPETPPEDPGVKQFDATLANYEAKLTKLSDERKKAREDVDMEKADSLSDEIADVRTQIGLLKSERERYLHTREMDVARSLERSTVASRDRFLEAHPELKDEGSLPRLALEAYVSKQIADPKRAHVFKDPNWPEFLGAEFIEKTGLKKPAGAPAKPAAAIPGNQPARPTPATTTPGQRPKPQQVPGAKALTSANGSPPSAPVVTAAQLKADLARMSPAQRRALVTAVR